MMLHQSIVTVRNPYGTVYTIRSEHPLEKRAAQKRAEKWAEYSRIHGKNEILSIRTEKVRG